jgi:biotin transport system substrate-specific component
MKLLQINQKGLLKVDKPIINILSIIFGSILLGILAQISIWIPFSPVPITGQTLGVLIIGGILGSKRGALTVLLYLLEGASGLPVFANMKAGAHVLVGPTAGYLWSFIFAAYLTGFFSEKGLMKNFLTSFLVCLLSTAIILSTGTIYLILIGSNFNEAFILGFYPFIIGGGLKSFLSSIILLNYRKIY